jgi:aryl-alcohol dehydrogenase-like predicted oxidoreductase
MDEGLGGHATGAGTRALADRAVTTGSACPQHFRRFGDLALSSLGMGTYLGDPDPATDRRVSDALSQALRCGAMNVVDTSINYRHQRAERAVGRALAEGVRNGWFPREGVFVSTKSGYLAPDSESGLPPAVWLAREVFGTGALRPEDVVGGEHAMSVPYLRDQLGRSLQNLGLETVDLLYLHNAAEGELQALGARRFEERLREAFAFYEHARRAGRIRWYGLASWDSLRLGRSERGYHSLERTVELAREVGGDEHGFRFIQFPLNPFMPEAAVLRNQRVASRPLTLLEAAGALGLGTFSSVPLLQGKALGLLPAIPGLTGAQPVLQFSRSAPGHLTALVGQKSPAHVRENLALARLPPAPEATFRSWLP